MTTIESIMKNAADRYPITEDHRMLLHIRDTLYERNWDDFIYDLRARAEGRPHVFEIVPTSDELKATIAGHLRMISDMQAWETVHGRLLRPDEFIPGDVP